MRLGQALVWSAIGWLQSRSPDVPITAITRSPALLPLPTPKNIDLHDSTPI